MSRYIHIFCFFIISVCRLNAQQLPLFSAYTYKPFVCNPAFAGDKDLTEIMALNRNQLSGFEGAPVLNLLCIDGKPEDKKVSLAFLVANQRKGILSNTNAMATYAYRLNLSEQTCIKFGLSLGIFDQSINYAKVVVANTTDPGLFNTAQRRSVADGNAGIAVEYQKFSAGIAVPQLFAGRINYNDNAGTRSYYAMTRHLAVSAKYDVQLNQITLSPNILLRMVKNAPLQYDAGISLNWNKQVWGGITYRSAYALGITAGLTLNRRCSVGYSYDYVIGPIAPYAGTSQEILCAVKLGKLKQEEEEQKRLERKIDELEEQLEDLKNKTTKIADKEKENQKINDKLQKTNPVQFSGKNVAREHDVYILTNKASDFTDLDGNQAQKGIFIVIESCFYTEYAETEAKKYSNFGFPNTDVLIDRLSKFNYVFIDTATTKEEAFRKVDDAKKAGIPDVWVQILTD